MFILKKKRKRKKWIILFVGGWSVCWKRWKNSVKRRWKWNLSHKKIKNQVRFLKKKKKKIVLLKASVTFTWTCPHQKCEYALLHLIHYNVYDPQAHCRSWFRILPSIGPRSHLSRILSLCVWCSASFIDSMMGWVSSYVPSPKPILSMRFL